MNIIQMSGGLGNQMFQYALYLKFRMTGTECKFDDFSEYEDHDNARPIQLDKFGLDYPRASRREVNAFTNGQPDLLHRVQRKVTGRRTHEYHEASCNYDPEVLLKEHTYLTGSFQSERYFRDIRDAVRRSFVFTEEVKKEAADILREPGNRIGAMPTLLYHREKKRAVSIHVRLGDYLDAPEVYGGICTGEYYRRAIDCVIKKVPDAEFVLFSNDVDWTKELLRIWNERYPREDRIPRFSPLYGTTEETGYIDLYLMSLCQHHIIANSSFSWWGAYLNADEKKLVVAPAKWSNKENYRDIYTDDMILI